MSVAQWHSLAGVLAFVLLAWLLSERRAAVPWRTVVAGVLLQFVLAVLLLRLPPVRAGFEALNHGLAALERATEAGASFVFGYLAGGPLPFAETGPGSSFVLAFRTLPLVLVVAALSSLLFYWRILPRVVAALSWLLRRTLGVGGAVGLATAANVFVGMVESPLLVRPYLARMQRSELFVVMTAGMATLAGTVLALYASVLSDVVPNAIAHLLIGSLVSAPAAIVVALVMVPPLVDGGTAAQEVEPPSASGVMDAIARGAADGVQLLIQVAALLIVLVALVSLLDAILAAVLPLMDGDPVTLQRVLGWVMAPVAWLMGIPWREAGEAGALLGVKLALNEFLAYVELSRLPLEAMSERSRLIVTYALCGFANFGSLGIMVGGLGALVPKRRHEVAALGLRAVVSGTLATCMTGAWVGFLTAG